MYCTYMFSVTKVVCCSGTRDVDMQAESELGQRHLTFLKVMVRFCSDLGMGMSMSIVIAR